MHTPKLTTPSLRNQLIATWLHLDNGWMDSASLHQYFDDQAPQKIYGLVNILFKAGVLERRKRPQGQGYEYRLTDPDSNRQAKGEPLGPPVTVVAEGKGGKKPKVFWRLQEELDVASEIARLRMTMPKAGLLHLLNLAQLNIEVIEPERRRAEIKSLASVPWLEERMKTAQPRLTHAERAALIPPLPAPAAVAPAVTVASLTTDALVGEVVRRFGDVFTQLVVHVLNSPEVTALRAPGGVLAALAPIPLTPPVAAAPAAQINVRPSLPHEDRRPAPTLRPHLPHVGVFGNRNDYADELRREFPQLDFTFIDSDKRLDALKNCDRVVVLTKFISHPAGSMLKRQLGERYVPIDGAKSELKRVLHCWVNSGILQKASSGVLNGHNNGHNGSVLHRASA
jgi:hypothetical protein